MLAQRVTRIYSHRARAPEIVSGCAVITGIEQGTARSTLSIKSVIASRWIGRSAGDAEAYAASPPVL